MSIFCNICSWEQCNVFTLFTSQRTAQNIERSRSLSGLLSFSIALSADDNHGEQALPEHIASFLVKSSHLLCEPCGIFDHY